MKQPYSELVTEVLSEIGEIENPTFAIAYITEEGNVALGMRNCSVDDLQHMASTINNHAILKMIAVNTEYIEELKEESDEML